MEIRLTPHGPIVIDGSAVVWLTGGLYCRYYGGTHQQRKQMAFVAIRALEGVMQAHQKRVVTELAEVHAFADLTADRLQKLTAFVAGDRPGFVNEQEWQRLVNQRDVMGDVSESLAEYAAILETRVKAF